MSAHIPPFQPRVLDIDLYSDLDCSKYHAKVLADRAIATKKPLTSGLQFAMALEIPQQNPDPQARFVPIEATTSHVRGSTTSLRLVDALQPGINMFSQVWTAAPVDAPDTRLILKIIQPSMCHCPEPGDNWGFCFADPWNLAHQETWVYQNLVQMQGLAIPYFFGMHTITTPSKEEAWVLVLEFIPGPTLDTVVRSKSMPMLQNCCRLGMAAVHGLARNGWYLNDIRAPNFILNGTPGPTTVVIVDLYGARPIPPEIDDAVANRVAETFWSMMTEYMVVHFKESSVKFFEWGLKDEAVKRMLAWPDEEELTSGAVKSIENRKS